MQGYLKKTSELVDMYKFSLNVNQNIFKMFWMLLLAVLQGKICLCSYSHRREMNFGPKVLRRYMLAYNFLPAIHNKGKTDVMSGMQMEAKIFKQFVTYK